MTTPKSPEQILEGFKDLIHLYENYQLVNDKEPKLPDEAWLRSSMASLLCYMAERMGKKEHIIHDGIFPAVAEHAANNTIDDCRTLLIEEARRISEV